MAAEDHDWMLCMLFAVLGVVFGSFFSSVYPAFIAPSCKAVSAGCRKASSASSVSRTRGLRLCCNAENMEGQRQTLFDTCESQLGASKHPNNCTEERNQKKSTLDFCDDTSDSLQHQRNASQHPLYHITKMGQGGNHLDAYESHSHIPHHPSTESPISDDHDCNHVQTRELSILSPTPSKDSTMPNGNLKPDPFDPSKRHGYLSWDDYFMAIAFLSAHRSKDPNRQVGACLVSQDRVILGIGYNGFPRGCSDDKLPWAKMSVNGDPLQTKYPYVCHAEVNAILNKNHASACGQRLYVTMFPCNECAKIIIQAGVAEVIYFVGKTSSADCSYIASQKLLSMAGVKVWQHQPAQHKVVLDFK